MIRNNNYHKAFTIVELIVVTIVVGILVLLAIIGFNQYKKRIDEVSIKSDLSAVSGAMNNARNFSGGYPLNPTFSGSGSLVEQSNGVSLSYVSGDSSNYCVDGISTSTAGLRYFINTANGSDPKKGSCLTGEAPDLPDGTFYWTSLAVTSNHSCGLASNGYAYCWGENTYGQLGNTITVNGGKTPGIISFSGVLAGKSVLQIATEDCLIASDGAGYCWGRNINGRFGNGNTTDSIVPTAVNMSGVLSGKKLRQISAVGDTTCAIASDGRVYCWGNNWAGQLGDGTTTTSYVPVAVDISGVLSGKNISRLSSTSAHSCVIADGKAYCWGYNNSGSLGNGTTINSSVPVAVNATGALSDKTIDKISSHSEHTCVIASDGRAYCWGLNWTGELGYGVMGGRVLSPIAVSTAGALAGKTITQIATGNGYSCAIDSDGKGYCWGKNDLGQLGNNTTTDSAVPVAVDMSGVLFGRKLTHIATGGAGGHAHTCAIANDGNAYCWGWNIFGQLGNNTTNDSTVPVLVTKP